MYPSILSKNGNVVALSMYLVAIGNTTKDTILITLPIGFRPASLRYCNVAVTAGSSGDETPYYIRLSIGTDGAVTLGHEYTHKATHAYLMGTMVFSI